MNNILSSLKKMCQTLPTLVKAIGTEIEDSSKYVRRGDLGISISPALLEVDPDFNTRHEGYDSLEDYFKVPAHRHYLEQMKAAYRAGENLPPPIQVQVKDNRIIIRDGHCRFFAINELLNEGVQLPLIRVDESTGDDQQNDLKILKTQPGILLSAFATGAIYNRLVNHGWSLEQIGAEFNYTPNHIQNQIDMYRMDKQLKKLVLNNIVSASMMLQMVRTANLRTDQIVQLIDQQVKTKNKTLLARLEEKRAKLAKRKGEEAAENIDIDDETLFAQVMQESNESMYNNTSGRSFLKPSDIRAKALPKKVVEELHTFVIDFDPLKDESRITQEEGSDVVLMKISVTELNKMRELRDILAKHDEQNLMRMGAQISDSESESANAENMDVHDDANQPETTDHEAA